MPKRHTQAASRSSRRGRVSERRRLTVETLESRACPAVLLDFAMSDSGGVLTITGDDRPNTIDLFQLRDGVVEVQADGEQYAFEGVAEIVVAAGEGDDQIEYSLPASKPKEIVVVPRKLRFDAGPGNDLIALNDSGGDVTGRITSIAVDPFNADIDLGTGADQFRLQLDQHAQVELNLTSEDGSDRVLVGMLLPAVQKVREAAAKMNIELGGGGNLVGVTTQNFDHLDLTLRALGGDNVVKHELGHALGFRHEHIRPETTAQIDMNLAGDNNRVNVRLENIEDVSLSLVAAPPPGEVARGGTINVYWHVITNSPGAVGHSDSSIRMVQFGAVSAPGEAAAPRMGVRPSSLSFTTMAGGVNNASSATVVGDFGPLNDSVSVQSRNIDGLDIGFDTGEGNDLVQIDSRAGVGILRSMDGGRTYNRDPRTVALNLNLGTGNDRLIVDTSRYGQVNVFIAAGDGDDDVLARHRMFSIVDRTRLHFVALLGAGIDSMRLEAHGFREVNTEIDLGSASATSQATYGRSVFRLFLDGH